MVLKLTGLEEFIVLIPQNLAKPIESYSDVEISILFYCFMHLRGKASGFAIKYTTYFALALCFV